MRRNLQRPHFVGNFSHGLIVAIALVGLLPPAFSATDPPEPVVKFLNSYCVDCHGPKEYEGELRLDQLSWDLAESSSRETWELIQKYVSDKDMPPKDSHIRLPQPQRESFLRSLSEAFSTTAQTAKVGGTPPRRLNRVEYHNTVRDLFNIRMIKLPLSFPVDAPTKEFDTMPEGLFLSPAVMEAYYETATDIADRLVPISAPPRYQASYKVMEIGGDNTRRWFGPGKKGKEFLKFTGFNNSGWSGALWDSQFVAPACGVYKVRLLANAQSREGADGKPLRLAFYAFDIAEEQLPKRYRRDRAARVAEVEVPQGEPTWLECLVPVEKGETFHIYCENRFPPDRFSMGALNRSQINKSVNAAKNDSAPTVELRQLEIDGPVDVSPRIKSFFGSFPPQLDRNQLEDKLLPLARRAFRRRLTIHEKEKLFAAVLEHGRQTGRTELAWHYAIRRLLCSPAFLYREGGNEPSQSESQHELDPFTLASRLSYLFWSSLPDEELLLLAADGRLMDPAILEQQTLRLIADPRSEQFIRHFSGQWLGNRTVATINVCDNRYPWDDQVRYGFVRSTELFFEEVLRSNLPIQTFVDSDFTYANNAMQVAWGMKGVGTLKSIAADQRQSLVWPEPERIDLNSLSADAPDHLQNRRGVLGLPGVLTVTGDGVESSPILRGVWVLENLFGQHPPPPPQDVPALNIDTSKAQSIRETLAAHQKSESCAKCHRDIDPIGLALENFDAIGGWRKKYVGQNALIDTSAELPDGTLINGPASIRKMLLKDPAVFTRCLVVKLLQYGAGRTLSVGDQRVADEIVAAEPDEGYKFQDLLVAITTSKVFLAK